MSHVFLICCSAVCILLSICYFYYVKLKKYNAKLVKLPGPTPLPFFGNSLDFTDSVSFLPTMHGYIKKHGPSISVQIGPWRNWISVTDVKLLEFFMSSIKFIDKSRDYNLLHPWLGTGLLTSSGKKWHIRRKIITPAFHFEILEQFIDVFNESGLILVDKLRKNFFKQSLNIYPYVTCCTLDTVCKTAMGTSMNAQDEPDSDYVKCVKAMGLIAVARTFSAWKTNDFLFRFSSDYRRMKKCLQVLHGYSNSVITKRREALKMKSNDEHKIEPNAFDKKKRVAFLDLLLEVKIDGNPLSNEDIREEVDTFMFEGHDTTASAISFALFCLANNKKCQDLAFEEMHSIYGKDQNKPVTFRDLQEMKYLELVIKETLRLYPSVPFYARELQEDVEYEGKIFPKGLSVNLFAYAIHRDPTHFPNPEKFDPTRFLSENQNKRHPFSYIPFSAGPRNCIGQKFAMLEMKSIIAIVLRNYELFSAVPEHKLMLAAESILKSANGISIQLRKRSYL